MALVDLDLKLKGMGAKIVNTMQDKTIVEAKAEIAEEVGLILKETMEEAGRSFLKIVPVETEVGVRQPAGAGAHSLRVL